MAPRTPVQPPTLRVDFLDREGKLTPQSLQLLQALVRNTQGETPDEGTIRLGPVNIHYGSGTPLGNVTGSPPDLYLRLDGGAATCLYVKESGVETTAGWVAK